MDNLKTTVGVELIAMRRNVAKTASDLGKLKLTTSGAEFGDLHAAETALLDMGFAIDNALSGLSQRVRLMVVMPVAKFSQTIDTRVETATR